MASSSCITTSVTVCALLLLCAATLVSSSSKERRARYCGKDLLEAVNLLCDGEIYDPAQKRDSVLPPWVSFLDGRTRKLGFLDAKTALQLLRPSAHFGRQTRGIIEECCYKSCTLNTLLEYCGNKPSVDE